MTSWIRSCRLCGTSSGTVIIVMYGGCVQRLGEAIAFGWSLSSTPCTHASAEEGIYPPDQSRLRATTLIPLHYQLKLHVSIGGLTARHSGVVVRL